MSKTIKGPMPSKRLKDLLRRTKRRYSSMLYSDLRVIIEEAFLIGKSEGLAIAHRIMSKTK